MALTITITISLILFYSYILLAYIPMPSFIIPPSLTNGLNTAITNSPLYDRLNTATSITNSPLIDGLNTAISNSLSHVDGLNTAIDNSPSTDGLNTAISNSSSPSTPRSTNPSTLRSQKRRARIRQAYLDVS